MPNTYIQDFTRLERVAALWLNHYAHHIKLIHSQCVDRLEDYKHAAAPGPTRPRVETKQGTVGLRTDNGRNKWMAAVAYWVQYGSRMLWRNFPGIFSKFRYVNAPTALR